MLSCDSRKEADGINTSVDIAGITLKNPVMPASGTFGSGQEPGMVEYITKEIKKKAA